MTKDEVKAELVKAMTDDNRWPLEQAQACIDMAFRASDAAIAAARDVLAVLPEGEHAEQIATQANVIALANIADWAKQAGAKATQLADVVFDKDSNILDLASLALKFGASQEELISALLKEKA